MTGPARRRSTAGGDPGLNYAAIGASTAVDVVTFPPAGFRAAEYRHRIGSGAGRFDAAGRSLMTWGALRSAGFRVDDVRAESRAAPEAEPLFLEDGTPWITPGMTAAVSTMDAPDSTGPVLVLAVIDEPGRIGFVYGSMSGNPTCGERFLLLEHDAEDAVWLTLRSVWQAVPSRFAAANRGPDARQRRLDERIVRALHPSYAA